MPKRILIVDDEPMVRDLCRIVLQRDGFDTVTASNGLEGLEQYKENPSAINLILTDVSMPKMTGIEMVKTIFGLNAHSNVVIMSGNNLGDLVPDDVRRLCSVVEKPFSAAELISAVRKCLDYEEHRVRNEATEAVPRAHIGNRPEEEPE